MLRTTGDSNRWRVISVIFGLPVVAFGIVQSTKAHEHIEAPPEYPYLKMATRVGYLYTVSRYAFMGNQYCQSWLFVKFVFSAAAV